MKFGFSLRGGHCSFLMLSSHLPALMLVNDSELVVWHGWLLLAHGCLGIMPSGWLTARCLKYLSPKYLKPVILKPAPVVCFLLLCLLSFRNE